MIMMEVAIDREICGCGVGGSGVTWCWQMLHLQAVYWWWVKVAVMAAAVEVIMLMVLGGSDGVEDKVKKVKRAYMYEPSGPSGQILCVWSMKLQCYVY